VKEKKVSKLPAGLKLESCHELVQNDRS